ncbi:MAG: hypothetical protein QMC36_04870 [Patescibacteria group bacterium]
MALRSEIKDFVRRVLLLGVLLSFFVNIAYTYYRSVSTGNEASANGNDVAFKKKAVPYLGDTAVALSLNVGLSKKSEQDAPVRLYEDVMPIAAALSDKGEGRKKVISSNMVAASEYLNILKTDVNKLLDQSSDRQATLESFTDQLKYRYKSTNSYLGTLSAQRAELQQAVTDSTTKIDATKAALSVAYKNLDYDKTEELLSQYLELKDRETYARTYLVFVDKFAATFSALNTYNKTLLDTLINNREALIKDVTVVLPDSGTELMKKLSLIKTEAEFKAQ